MQLDGDDITELCNDMQRYIQKFKIGSQDFNNLIQQEPNFSNEYELSLAFKSTIKRVCQLSKKLSEERDEPTKKRKRGQLKAVIPNAGNTAQDEGDSQLMLADEDLSSWTDKISEKFFNMTGNDVKENVALKGVKIAANRQTIQLECPLETCHEKLTVYKELPAKGGKYLMSGLLMHIKRKHQC